MEVVLLHVTVTWDVQLSYEGREGSGQLFLQSSVLLNLLHLICVLVQASLQFDVQEELAVLVEVEVDSLTLVFYL